MTLSTLLLVHFQNCAPVKPSDSYASPGAQPRLIDEYNKSEIQFVEPEVQLHSAMAAADISGMCSRSHNGSSLKWTLWAATGETVSEGASHCGSGSFHVEIADLEKIACGKNYQLVIEGDWGDSAFTAFIRRCEPWAAEILSPQHGVPPGTECAIELAHAKGNCTQACYRGGLLVSQTAVEPSLCSNIASRVAGR